MKPEDNIFQIVSVQTTYQCNMACANCYLGDMLNNPRFPDVDVKKFKEAISKLPNRCDIRFIGAEPTLNPNLFELIKIARHYKHRPQILTNGLKLAQEDYVKELKASGCNFLGLSMNGGLDDEMYKRFDGGKFATVKLRALENCIKHNIVVHINVILDPTNLHVLKPLVDHVVYLCKKHNKRVGMFYPLTIRVKSVARMGNYLDTYTYSLPELIQIMRKNFGEIHPVYTMDGTREKNICVFGFDTEVGVMRGKCTDWTVDDDGLPDRGSRRRGILTDRYEIEPFFEYYGGINETRTPRLERSRRTATVE